MMTSLEDVLRATFAAQVTVPPVLGDPAGRAMRRAMRIRRRRIAFGAGAVVMCLALSGAGIMAGRDSAAGSGQVSAASSVQPMIAVSVDVLDGQRIVQTHGAVIDLASLPDTRRAWRYDGGWLVETWRAETDTAEVWHVRPNGQPTLLARGDRVAVGSGPRVAWGLAGAVSVARMRGVTLDRAVRTPGTGAFGPIGFTADGVVLSDARTGDGRGGESRSGTGPVLYDMWFPGLGRYVAGPRRTYRILGPTHDGSKLFALSDSQRPCLLTLDPVGLTQTAEACGLRLNWDVEVLPSPDGRWLAVVDAGRIDLYDLVTMWSENVPKHTWWIESNGASWVDNATLAIGGQAKVTRLSVSDPTILLPAPVTGATRAVSPIPTLGR